MKLCRICSYRMPACIEGDYCPDCLAINVSIVGDYRVDPEVETIIKNNWKHYFNRLNKIFKETFLKDLNNNLRGE